MRITKKLTDKVHKDLMGIGWTIIDTSELIEKYDLKFKVKDFSWQKTPKIKYKKLVAKLKKVLNKSNLESEFDYEYGSPRYERANDKRHISSHTRNWHTDGSYLRAICCVEGPTTQVKHNRKVITLPLGHTLLITAHHREEFLKIPSTPHRGPGDAKDRRKLFVFAFCRKGIPSTGYVSRDRQNLVKAQTKAYLNAKFQH